MKQMLVILMATVMVTPAIACCLTWDPPPTPIAPSEECVVKDELGQLWTWRGSPNACTKAMHDCQRFQLEFPHRYHACTVIKHSA